MTNWKLGQQGASEPLVSIVVAAYNAESTISETLRSLVHQSHSRIEIIVCDDASTDGTSATVRSFDDHRIILLRNEDNLGPGRSRDRAIDHSSGDWLAFVDADDACHPTRIARMLAAAGDDRDVIVFDNTVLCHDAADGMVPWRPIRRNNSFGARSSGAVDVKPVDWIVSKKMLMHPLISSGSVRSRGIRHSDLRFAEDCEFVLKLVADGAKLRYLPEALYLYRITPGSLSANKNRWNAVAEVFRNSAPLFLGDEEAVAALEKGAERNEFLHRHQGFVENLKTGRWITAVGQAVREPALTLELARRISLDVAYHAHRITEGGRRR